MYRQVKDIEGAVSTALIQRVEDAAFIPTIEENRGYQEYLLWVAAGNVILPPEE